MQPESGGLPEGDGLAGSKAVEEWGRPGDDGGHLVGLPKFPRGIMLRALQSLAECPMFIHRRHRLGSRQPAAKCPLSKQRKHRFLREGFRKNRGGWVGRVELRRVSRVVGLKGTVGGGAEGLGRCYNTVSLKDTRGRTGEPPSGARIGPKGRGGGSLL